MQIAVKKLDEVHSIIDSADNVLFEIDDAFTFDVPGAQYSPAFRNKHWDGRLHLFRPSNRRLLNGLIPRLIEFANRHGHNVEFIQNPTITDYSSPDNQESEAKIGEILQELSNSFPHSPREYQIRALKSAI